jgi:hypothetical protein
VYPHPIDILPQTKGGFYPILTRLTIFHLSDIFRLAKKNYSANLSIRPGI